MKQNSESLHANRGSPKSNFGNSSSPSVTILDLLLNDPRDLSPRILDVFAKANSHPFRSRLPLFPG